MNDGWGGGADREARLAAMLRRLDALAYAFVPVTPATHERVLAQAKRPRAGRTIRDLLGWSMAVDPAALPPGVAEALAAADALEPAGEGLVRARIRVARLGGRLFAHSAFPTIAADSVFLGPDSYRFAAFIARALVGAAPARHLVDLGAGAGVGGIVARAMMPGTRATLVDVNPRALAMARANAAAAGIAVETVEAGHVDAVPGPIDLVIANPPFIVDDAQRAYRDGGDLHGGRVPLDWALSGAARLAPGGTMLLYTGAAYVEGRAPLLGALAEALPGLGCTSLVEDIDPDIFGEELSGPAYDGVERIAAVGITIRRG